jgi:hypothetical protein
MQTLPDNFMGTREPVGAVLRGPTHTVAQSGNNLLLAERRWVSPHLPPAGVASASSKACIQEGHGSP